MRSNDVLGIIFSNSCEDTLSTLTAHRTTASVPIGGKYRMIDFALSNMTNSNMNNVGIIAKSGFMSLMDHVGSGKAWDLSKKNKGVTILPPYAGIQFANKVETLYRLRGYIEDANEEYVLLTESNVITNIDYRELFYLHSQNEADITLICKNMKVPDQFTPTTVSMDEIGRIDKILVQPNVQGECNLYLGTMLIKKDLLIKLLTEAVSENEFNFERLLQKWANVYRMFGYGCEEYCAIISSTKEYYEFNMGLMDNNTLQKLTKLPVYTKVRDDSPCKYGLESSVKHCLISQGCVIEGYVENCIISKGVHIAKGAKVSNCIIMQDTEIGENCNLNYLIIDKDVVIKDSRDLMGTKSYPIYIAKKSIIN